jgi:hypothetical protein
VIGWIIRQTDINGFAFGKFNDPLDELGATTAIFRAVIGIDDHPWYPRFIGVHDEHIIQ